MVQGTIQYFRVMAESHFDTIVRVLRETVRLFGSKQILCPFDGDIRFLVCVFCLHLFSRSRQCEAILRLR